MAARALIFFGFALLLVAGLLVYLIIRQEMPRRPAEVVAPPRRDPRRPIRWMERRPSAGLAWSKKAYPEQYGPENTRTSDFVLRPLDTREEERFLDVAGRAYSREVIERFAPRDPTSPGPHVTVEYLARAETFVGRIRGTGLKPNFAYQLKLLGRYADDPSGFEKIGYTGRWRLPGQRTNFTDREYEEFPRKDLAEAYLLFDFLVTDATGSVDKEFYADSSLHVLWNASTQRAPAPEDSAQVVVERAGSPADIYVHPRPDLRPQRVYAESEQHQQGERNHRKPIGQAFLPPGRYRAYLALTEESFHGYGDAGTWATVMTAPVEFEVTDQPRPPPESPGGNLAGRPLPLGRAELVDIAATVRSDDLLEGSALSDSALVIFPDPVPFGTEKRRIFVAEFKARGRHTWHLFLDIGAGFESRPTHSFTTSGGAGWQRFEVEITSLVAGRTVRFAIQPTVRPGFFGLRNVGVYATPE